MTTINRNASEASLAAGVADAYTYAYPLVLMDVTRAVSTNVRTPHGLKNMGQAPINQFAHVRIFVPGGSTVVVRPNDDTLYSLAWLDLIDQPLVLSVGKTYRTFYLLPILDAWTNAVANAPGSRNTGDGGGNYLLCGPDWSGATPDGLTRLDVPTNMAWILGRVECHGERIQGDGGGDHYAKVWKIQDSMHLVPLSEWTGDPTTYTPPLGHVNDNMDMSSPPGQVAALTNPDCSAFFTRFCSLMAANPPNPTDPVMSALFERLGLLPGAQIDWSATMGADDFAAAQAAAAQALADIEAPTTTTLHQTSVNLWEMLLSPRMANYGRDYAFRAAIAGNGLGANLLLDAIYPTCFTAATVDGGDAGTLDGSNTYTLTFANGQTPPMRGFWSVTAYTADGYFISNPLKRYAIHNWDAEPAADGSLTITLRALSADEGDPGPNVLPVAAGASFNLTMRIYWPDLSAIDGAWEPPLVVQTS